MRDQTEQLQQWLAAGGRMMGQVAITPLASGWELRHVDDAALENLHRHERPTDARAIANLDAAGNFRPLKTAPTLRRGWVLEVRDVGELRKALEGFYPAMLGLWCARAAGEVAPVDLRETLGRQTGMYRVTQKLTDEQAQDVIARTCNLGSCIKTILWQIAPGQPITSLSAEKFTPPAGGRMPLWCHEACNILVAAARATVKGEAA